MVYKTVPVDGLEIFYRESGDSEHLIKKVLDHQLDGAFVAGPINHPSLISKKVKTEKLCLIVTKKYAEEKDLSGLLEKPLLVFPQGCSYRKRFEHWLNDRGIVANKIYEFSTLSAIFASVMTGLGIALFPKSSIDEYQLKDELQIISIPEKYEKVEIDFIYRKDRYLTQALKNFIEELKK